MRTGESRFGQGARMRQTGSRIVLHLGWFAGVCFGASVLAATSLAGFDHAPHVGLLGSALAPQALAFNLVGFGLTGFCMAGFALALERSLEAQGVGRGGRLATSLLLIAGLAFTAQGLFPFEPDDVDGAQSRRHVFAYTIALLAWLPSTVLMAWALRGRRAWRPLPWLGLAFTATMLLALIVPGGNDEPGHAQRGIFVLYFAWLALVAAVALRVAPTHSRIGDA